MNKAEDIFRDAFQKHRTPLLRTPEEMMKQIQDKQNAKGVKTDTGKPRYSLIPPYALEQVAICLTEGLRTHPEKDNWKLVENAEERYLDSLIRHVEQYRQGQYYDKDSPTVPNLAAVIVNALFLLEFKHNPDVIAK